MKSSWGDMKLLLGVGQTDGWDMPPDSSGTSYTIAANDCDAADEDEDQGMGRRRRTGRRRRHGNGVGGGCYFLFDMESDPYERYNGYYNYTRTYNGATYYISDIISTMTETLYSYSSNSTYNATSGYNGVDSSCDGDSSEDYDSNDSGYDPSTRASYTGYWGLSHLAL